MNKNYIDEINGNYDAVNYRYSIDYKKEMAAFEEGVWWMSKGYSIESQNIYDRQPYVMLLLAQELFIKALLIEENKTISGHRVDKLFSTLTSKTQNSIIKKFELHDLPIIDKNDNEIMLLKTFNDYIKYVSNYFVYLRYDYEKIYKDEPTTIPRYFINTLTYELYSECYSRFSYAVKITSDKK